MLEMTAGNAELPLRRAGRRPIPSILRGFSAPVILDRKAPAEERAFLLAHDTDPFNKWEAGRALAKDVMARDGDRRAQPRPATGWMPLAAVALDDSLDPAFRAPCPAAAGRG